jgi:hypothetical protein
LPADSADENFSTLFMDVLARRECARSFLSGIGQPNLIVNEWRGQPPRRKAVKKQCFKKVSQRLRSGFPELFGA